MSGWGGRGVHVCVSASVIIVITCSCSPDPFFLELQHLVGEAHALISDDVGLGHSDILKEDLGRVGAPHAHLVNLLGDVDAYTSNSLYLPVTALDFFLKTSVTFIW